MAQLVLYPRLAKLGLLRSSQMIAFAQIPFTVLQPLGSGLATPESRWWWALVTMCCKACTIEMCEPRRVLASSITWLLHEAPTMTACVRVRVEIMGSIMIRTG